MLPTVVRLSAINLAQSAANDAGRALVARDIKGRFTPLSKAIANDAEDFAAKTLDRIMQRHNGHDRPIPVPANAPTAYEQTMDRIMQRNNGHDRILQEPANDLKQRIFHDPAGPLLQAGPKERQWEPYEEKPMLLRKKYKEGDDENENGSSDKPGKPRVTTLLRKIEKNVEKSTKILEKMLKSQEDKDDGTGVASLRAREMEIENRQGNRPWDRNASSSMDSEGKEDGPSEWAKKWMAMKSLKGDAVGALAMLTVGGLGSAAMSLLGNDDKQNPKAPGGGHTSSEMAPSRRADNPTRPASRAPKAAPRPDVVPGGRPDSNLDLSGNLTGREREFLRHISKNEGANQDTELAYGRYGSAEKMFGKKLSELTLSQVNQLQKAMLNNPDNHFHSSAVGSAQFVNKTLFKGWGRGSKPLLEAAGITPDMYDDVKFDAALQNKLALLLAKQSGVDPNDVEHWNSKQLKRLGSQWESLDSAHDKDGSKKAAMISDLKRASLKRENISKAHEKEAELTVWGKPTSVSAAEMKRIQSMQGKKIKLHDGSIAVHQGNSVTVNLAPPRKADAGAERLAAKLQEEKRRAPSAKPSESWTQLAKKYFGW